jgi:GTPase
LPLPEVLIVGRPNVGKSTLFNRLSGKALALVDNQPGSTRDLKSAEVEWNGARFLLTDSGGWVPGEKETISQKVGTMLSDRLERAAAVVFVVDGLQGVTPGDELVAKTLRKRGLPAWLLVNKVDQFVKQDESSADFHALGFEKVYAASAMHGIGMDDFLDSLVAALGPGPTPGSEEEPRKLLRIAILGKPNVGKSSLVNAILGTRRQIVDDLPGTTHDAVPVLIETEGDPFWMVDTAGIRASTRQDTRIETLSVQQALYELQTCQVVLLVVDGEKGITHQDVTLSKIVSEAFRPVVIVINKWDIHPKGAEQARAERITKRQMRLLSFAPVVFISAKTGLNLERVLPAAFGVYEESLKQVPTRAINQALQEAVVKQSPPFKNGHAIKILYGYQRTGHPPAIEIFANQTPSAAPSYLRYLEGELRRSLGLESTPLHLVLRERAEKREFKRPSFKRNFDPRRSANKNKNKGKNKKGRKK